MVRVARLRPLSRSFQRSPRDVRSKRTSARHRPWGGTDDRSTPSRVEGECLFGADLLGREFVNNCLVLRVQSSKVEPVVDPSIARRLKPKLRRAGCLAWPCGRHSYGHQLSQQAQHTHENGHLSQENVADGQDCERNNPHTERNTAEDIGNVADVERNTPDERNTNSSAKSNGVADVAVVALVGWGDAGGGARRPEICLTAQQTTNGAFRGRSCLSPTRTGKTNVRWSRVSEQFFRVDKWSVCRG